MSYYLWIAVIFVFVIVFREKKKRNKQIEILRKIRNRRNKIMNSDMLKVFVGKDCVVYTVDKYVSGVIEQINDNWLNIKTQDGLEMLNIEYIVRVKEYPLDKNGKKKWMLDW